MECVKLAVSGLPGPSFADLARHASLWGVVPSDDDETVLEKFATFAGTAGAIDLTPPPYRYGSFAVDQIGASEILMDHEVVQAHTLAADFAGCKVSAGTPPAADWTLGIARNGAQIGSITIQHTGAVTMTTGSAGAQTIAAGDIVTVTAPPATDAAIGRVRFTFSGETA